MISASCRGDRPVILEVAGLLLSDVVGPRCFSERRGEG